MSIADGSARREEKLEALRMENLHLRQLIGELLLKNQRLRELAVKDGIAGDTQPASA